MLKKLIKNPALYGYVSAGVGITLGGLVIAGKLPPGVAEWISMSLLGTGMVINHVAPSPINKEG